jgi:hypothetical protein
MTNLPGLDLIAQRESYRKVVSMGKITIPYLLERNSILWNITLSELTGCSTSSYISSEILDFWKNWAKENGY